MPNATHSSLSRTATTVSSHAGAPGTTAGVPRRAPRARLVRAMRLTSEIAAGFAVVIALAYFFGGGWIIANFVADE